ncbi:AAA family ATPase [Psychromicrobium sp. YIM B11713]|uniref:helix-turn-helix transcriptional regulator n=1 Tax=Psychromicrobium sp. YIM B11713 TaxID=3145233 RepID=UPI00374E4D75
MPLELFGRAKELEIVRELLFKARTGQGSALVISGDPGIGKTALVTAALETEDESIVLRCTGSRAESLLAYSGIHQFLWPSLDRLDALEEVQAQAVRSALGQATGRPDRFLVGAGVLSLISTIAKEQPVVLIVEDAHLLDADSLDCLSFVARRLEWEPAVLLFTSTNPLSPCICELPALELQALAEDSADELLLSARSELTDDQREILLGVAEGNPLGLLTLIPSQDLDPHQFTMGTRLQQSFAAQLEPLGERTQEQLLVVAAQEGAKVGEIMRVLTALGQPSWALDPAFELGIIESRNACIYFRQKLVQQLVYEQGPLEEKRLIHRAWAEIWSTDYDLDRRAWQLAAATLGQDDEIAALLDATGERARQRGGFHSAARALLTASRLSSKKEDVGGFLARAARYEWDAGYRSTASRLLQEAEAFIGSKSSLFSGGLAGLMEFADGESLRAAALFERDAQLDPQGTMGQILSVLAVRAQWSAALTDPSTSHQGSSEAGSVSGQAEGSEHPTVESRSDEVLRAWRTGSPLPEVNHNSSCAMLPTSSSWMLPPAPYAAAWGQTESTAERYRQAIVQERQYGNTVELAFVLCQMATTNILTGRWAEAAACASEASEIADIAHLESVSAQSHNSLAWLAALRGDAVTTRKLTETSLNIAARAGSIALAAAAHWHRGTALLITGQPHAALEALSRIRSISATETSSVFAALAAPDAAEAALLSRQYEEAEVQIELLRQWVLRSDAAWAQAAYLRYVAMHSDDAGSEQLFREALELFSGSEISFEQARTELLFAEWLRKKRRRLESRPYFSHAREVFTSLGVDPMIERAESGLELASNISRPKQQKTFDELTVQELRVARLAASGYTNRDIGTQLFISPRTVGHHLSSVFSKLGLSSRAELSDLQLTD